MLSKIEAFKAEAREISREIEVVKEDLAYLKRMLAKYRGALTKEPNDTELLDLTRLFSNKVKAKTKELVELEDKLHKHYTSNRYSLSSLADELLGEEFNKNIRDANVNNSVNNNSISARATDDRTSNSDDDEEYVMPKHIAVGETLNTYDTGIEFATLSEATLKANNRFNPIECWTRAIQVADYLQNDDEGKAKVEAQRERLKQIAIKRKREKEAISRRYANRIRAIERTYNKIIEETNINSQAVNSKGKRIPKSRRKREPVIPPSKRQ